MQQPGNKRAGDEQKKQGSSGIKLDGTEDGVPDPAGWRPIDDHDAAQLAAMVAGIDETCPQCAESTILLPIDLQIDEIAVELAVVVALGVGFRCGGESKAQSLPVR